MTEDIWIAIIAGALGLVMINSTLCSGKRIKTCKRPKSKVIRLRQKKITSMRKWLNDGQNRSERSLNRGQAVGRRSGER